MKNLLFLASLCFFTLGAAAPAKGAEWATNSKVELFQDKDALAPMLKIIDGARLFVFAQVLSLTCDASTEPLIQALGDKAKNGLDVRVAVNKAYAIMSGGCLDRMREAGIRILKAKIHGSYLVTDQDQLLIGSQSWARMFFESTGRNGLDRDLMVFIEGPTATDAFGDFLGLWLDFEGGEGKISTADLVNLDKKKRDQELASKKRVVQAGEAGRGRCRFVSQRLKAGERDLQELWLEQAKAAKKEILFSGVNVDGHFELAQVLKERAAAGLAVEYLGNGWDGGNGELTMLLNEWVRDLRAAGWAWAAGLVEEIRDWDRRRLLRKHEEQYDALAAAGVKVWMHSQFVHHKAALFDGAGVLISSANPSPESFEGPTEAGVFCLDPTLAKTMADMFQADRSRSVLYSRKN
jgi:phosphatidylserine/phosphatidylglycerophosphate/cardiolipin synthase-like enzyme